MPVYHRNKIYYIDYYADGVRRREKVGPDRRMAEQALAKRISQVAEGKFFEITKDEKIGFKDFSALYYENHSKVNKKSWWSDEYRIVLLNTYFGEKYLNQITALDVEKFKADRIKSVAPATVNRELALLKGIFSKAIFQQYFLFGSHNIKLS